MARCPQPDAAYAAACSAQTLCARRGFLRALLPELAALPAPAWLSSLEPLPDHARAQACRDHPQLMEALREVMSRVQPVFRGKDARVSRERRAAAERELQAAEAAEGAEGAEGGASRRELVERALALASEAVLRAPMDEEDEAATLALALWTRSAVLRARGAGAARGAGGAARGEGGPRAALADLRLALRARLPARMRAQYYWRTGHCYRECGEATRAKVSYELALRLLADEGQRARLRRDLEALDLTRDPPPPSDEREEISLTGGSKPSMPSLSKLIKIVEEEGKGRYAAARAPVCPGDVLLAEEPYAACLLPEHFGTHCLHCFTRLSLCAEEAAVWCPTCAGVAFCSQRCRDAALRYHVYECRFQDLFIGSGMSILCHIALRMVSQLGLCGALRAHARHVAGPPLARARSDPRRPASRKERLNRAKKALKPPDNNEIKEDKRDDDLELQTAQIYSLCTHSEQRTGDDYLKRFIVAVFLTECLYKADFFESCAPEELENSRWAVTELLVRNLQLLQFNAHEVFETLRARSARAAGSEGVEGAEGEGHAFRGARAHHVAVAVYPTGALFNHDCFPAVARFFVGRRLVLAATRPLAAGAPAAECYGPAAATRDAPDRRRALAARYWFICACDACKRPELWPTLAHCKDSPPPIRCLTAGCSGVLSGVRGAGAVCGQCGAALDAAALAQRIDVVEQCNLLFQEGARLLDAQRAEAARALLCAALARYHGVAAAPTRRAHLAHEALRTALLARGNEHVVPSPADRKHDRARSDADDDHQLDTKSPDDGAQTATF